MDINWGNVIISLLLTFVVYSLFPVIFSLVKTKEITLKKYKVICFVVNLIPFILFVALGGGSVYPYVIWTLVSISIGKKIMESKSLIVDPNSPEKLFVYYCPECHHVASQNNGKSEPQCPNCKIKMTKTQTTKAEWSTLSQNQIDEKIEQWCSADA